MTTISLRMPQDVVDDLKRVAPYLGFSGYQPLMRAYIGQGLRKDLARLEQTPQITYLLDSLRRQGVGDEVLAAAIAEMASQIGHPNQSVQANTKRDTRVEKLLAEESIEYAPTDSEQ
ncbi:MAG: hypothetical protein U0350_04845 [Caldilineaceae bacterium]